MSTGHTNGTTTTPNPALLAKLPLGIILGLPKPASGDIDNGWQIEVAGTVTFLFAFFAVVLRSFSRWKYAKLGWDDYIMVFAILQAFMATLADYIAVNWGLGRHVYYLTITQFANQQLWQYIAQTFCLNALTCGKISLSLSYLRIMRGGHQQVALKWLLYVVMFITVSINTLIIIAQFAQCIPAQKSWNPLIEGTCWQAPAQIVLVLLQGATSALTDFILAAFPFFLFQKLQVSRSSKTILLVLMSMGVVTGIFATVRTAEAGMSLNGPPSIDLSFNSIMGLVWAGMERNIALMISSIPPIRPLAAPVVSSITKTFSSTFSTLRSTRDNSGGKGSYNSKPSYGASYELKSGEKNNSSYVRVEPKKSPKAPNNTYLDSNTTTLQSGNHSASQERILPIQRTYDVEVV